MFSVLSKPVISEPIKSDELPDDVELLKETIVNLKHVNNGVMQAHDNHVANLLSKVLWLEGRLKLAEDHLAAANRTPPLFAAAPATLNPIRTPAIRPLTSPGFYSPISSRDYDPPIFPSVEEEEPATKRASPARSTRRQTRGSSRVSKSKDVGKRSGKVINKGRRDCVRKWSEDDRFD